MYNRVILIGNLTKNVELREAGQSKVARFGLALNRVFKSGGEKKEETTFVDVEVWGSQGENCAKYLAKGRKVLVEGRLKLDTWEDKTSGEKRSKLFIVGENVQFLSSKEKESTESTTETVSDDVPF